MRFIIAAIFLLNSSLVYSIDDVTAQGFHWYTEDADPPKVLPERTHTSKAQSPSVEPYQELLGVRKNLNNKLAEALLRPSYDSTKNYMTAQQEINKKNQKFVMYWEQVLVSNPELDYTLKAPTDNSAIEERNKEKLQFIERVIKMASKRYGLIFIYQGNSLVSARFATIIKSFTEHYEFSIAPVSIDNKVLPEFPDTILVSYQSIEEKLRIKRKYTPALLFVDTKTKKIMPLSYGFMSESNLKTRILDVMTKFKRHSFEGLDYGALK